MHMLTIPYMQFAANNLVHVADQITNSHAEKFICGRPVDVHQRLEVGGDNERMVTGGQSWWLHKETRHSDQAPIT